MSIRIETLVALIIIAFLSITPFLQGEFSQYFIKSYVLVPYFLLVIALMALSFGFKNTVSLFTDVIRAFVLKSIQPTNSIEMFRAAKKICYIASLIWPLYGLIIFFDITHPVSQSALFKDVFTSLAYGFICSEIILQTTINRYFIK